MVLSAAATTASVAAFEEAGGAVIGEAGAAGALGADAEVEATSAGVSVGVFFLGEKYCRPRKIKTKTTEKIRRVRESCPPPPG